jgi:Tfp pilus assembly protein PilO
MELPIVLSQNRKKIFKGATLIVILFFIYFILGTNIPGIIMIFNLYNDYQLSVQKLDRDIQWQEKIIALKRDINRIKNEIKEINLEIPTERDLSSPLNYLDSLRQSNGVKLNSFEVLSIDTSRQYKIALISAKFSGKFIHIKKFITELENGSFIISIKSINLELQSLYRQEIETKIDFGIILKRKKRYKT